LEISIEELVVLIIISVILKSGIVDSGFCSTDFMKAFILIFFYNLHSFCIKSTSMEPKMGPENDLNRSLFQRFGELTARYFGVDFSL
jgi:hypothetical protein